jgi:hypothetical protein
MIEELRPSVLDNFGLFAALKWQLQRSTDGSNTIYTEFVHQAQGKPFEPGKYRVS